MNSKLTLALTILFNFTLLPSIGINFTGMTSQSAPDKIGVPPDTMGTLGTKQYVVLLNTGVRSFAIDREKGTAVPDGVLDCTLDAFCNGAGTGPFDPRIFYEQSSKFFFTSAIDIGEAVDTPLGGGNNNLYLGAVDTSKTDGEIKECTDITIFKIPFNLVPDTSGQVETNDAFNDYPFLGVSENAIFVSAHTATESGTPNSGFALYVIKKSSLFEGNSLVVTAVLRSPTTTPQLVFPATAHIFDSNPEFGYFFTTDDFAPSVIKFWRVINPGSNSPTLSPLISLTPPEIPPFGIDLFDAPHKGNLGVGVTGLLGVSFNNRFGNYISSAGHVRNHQLFFCHHIGVNGAGVSGNGDEDRDGIRWYQFDLTGDPTGQAAGVETATTVPALVQSGTIFDPGIFTNKTKYYYFPSMMTNDKGDMVIGCSVSAEDEFVDGVYFTRSVNDPLGQVEGPFFITQSEHSYNFEFSPVGQRWGDYSETSLDPVNGDLLWTIQQFTADTDVWGVQVAQISV